jgi:hypothetical protein
MSSFNNNAPNLTNKSYFSPNILTQGTGRRGGFEYECPASLVNNGIFTSNIGTSNIGIPLSGEKLEYSQSELDAYLTSNAMVDTANFNVIKLDIDNSKGEANLVLDIYYGTTQNLSNAVKKFSTIIEVGDLFYRNYPVENQYFNFTIKNVSEANRAKFNGRVTMSRYTQFSVPTQISDNINRFSLGNVSRSANSFDNDILIDRVSDIQKTDRLGVMDSVLATKQSLWNHDSAFNFTSNLSTDMVARSDNPLDTMTILIGGKSAKDIYQSEQLTLSGTSNVFGILNYKVIDDIVVSDGLTNTGNVVIERVGSGEVMNYMNAGAGRSTSMIYTCPENKKAIIKTFSLNGTTALNTESKVKLYKVQDNERNILVYQNNTRDAQIIESQDLDIKLDAGETIYGEVDSSNITSNLGDSYFSSRLNVLEYSLSNDKII